jgi:NAD(P)-dependent dehydrogenase (short-subunit alcohol dehydrogenase family)
LSLVGPPAVEYPADGPIRPVTRSVWSPVQMPPPAVATSVRLRAKNIVILGGNDESARRIATTLEASGATTHRCPPAIEDVSAAITDFKRAVGFVDGIIDLNVEEAVDPMCTDAWVAPLRQSVALIKACYEEWARETDATRLFYLAVTRMGGTMGYSGNDLAQPLGGIWAGLAKSLPREMPNCNVKVLDLSSADHEHLDRIVARELYDWGLFEIGYRQGTRHTLYLKRESPGAPSIAVTPEDVVLVSGGGRGIGFAFAREFTRNFGCRVIVTGRTALPIGDEPWLVMNEASFKSHTRDLYTSIPKGKTVAEVRRGIEGLRNRRELYMNLRQAAAEGLRIEYRPCDVTSREQVRQLLEEIGPALSGVVHNAGIDTPARLHTKSLDSFVATVATKVDGFTNIVHGLEGRHLKFLCNVGSLTGRWGGMVGQMDYASANEGLARLGLWAAQRLPYPVKTLCWTTWERLGMVTNFEASAQYMAPMGVEEGVFNWQRELLAAGSGEVDFMGPVGRALLPVHLKGYPPISDMSSSEPIYSQYFHVGEVLEFRPFRFMKAQSTIETATAPCLTDFTVQGRPSLPVSLVLETAVALASWISPPGDRRVHLHELRDVMVDPSSLPVEPPHFVIEKTATGDWQDGAWIVDIALLNVSTEGPRTLARLRVAYELTPPAAAPPIARIPIEAEDAALAPGSSLAWAGTVFRLARWSRSLDGTLVGEVSSCKPSDLWSSTYLPDLVLPASQLENILRAAGALQTEAHSPMLSIRRLRLYNEAGPAHVMLSGAKSGSWLVADRRGRVCLELEGLACSLTRDAIQQAGRSA